MKKKKNFYWDSLFFFYKIFEKLIQKICLDIKCPRPQIKNLKSSNKNLNKKIKIKKKKCYFHARLYAIFWLSYSLFPQLT